MKRSIGLGIATLCLSAQAAQADTYHFYSSQGGLKPFYWEDAGHNRGIIPDILRGIKGLKLELLEAPRKRIDAFFLEERIDLAMMNPAYTEIDEHLFFIPIGFSQKNVLYENKNNAYRHKTLDDIRNVVVCARHGYIYINMEDRWKKQNLNRQNLRSNEKLIKMLSANRCNYAITSSVSMNYLLKETQEKNIRETDIIVNEVPRYLAVSKRFPELKRKIEDHVATLKKSGKLQEILNKYAP